MLFECKGTILLCNLSSQIEKFIFFIQFIQILVALTVNMVAFQPKKHKKQRIQALYRFYTIVFQVYFVLLQHQKEYVYG